MAPFSSLGDEDNFQKVFIGLTDDNTFRKTGRNGLGPRNGGNFRQSISGVVPLGQQLIIIC